MPLIGKSLGRYHILEQLGEGGMATVYKAFDTRLEREVAVKVILPSRRQAPKFLQRFDREAKSLAQLSHPNIVKVLDYGEHEGLPYLVMEYLPGGTLKGRLGEAIPWDEAARLLMPIAGALKYAHDRKIVHRDVKPSNILITETGQPMLSDFGIAKVLEAEKTWDLTGTGVGIGTPEYMAPEQGMGKPVDHRADIYALGIVFYELVTGRKPFRADTPLAVLLKQVNDPFPPPRAFVKDLPKRAEQVLFKALAKDAEDRYQDMGAFAEALNDLAKEYKAPIVDALRVPGEKARRLIRLGGLATIGIFAVAGLFWAVRYLSGGRDLPQLISTSTKETESTKLSQVTQETPSASITPLSSLESELNHMIYDGFDFPEYDGGYNFQKWQYEADSNIVIKQNEGKLVFQVAPQHGRVTNSRLTMIQPNRFLITDEAFLEARMMILSDHQGGYMNVTIKMNASPGGDIWWSQCGLVGDPAGPHALFDVTNYSRDSNPEYQPIIPIQFDTWYTLRMVVSPESFRVSYFLNDQLIGSVVPRDVERLRESHFTRTLDTYVEPDTTMSVYVDFVHAKP